MLRHIGGEALAIEFLNRAAAAGSPRARLETAFLTMQTDVHGGIAAVRALGTYGTWKIAQCYRYGLKTERDLTAANIHYLEALRAPDLNVFPEIVYDAGDFATYCAFAQKDPELFKQTITISIGHFNRAGTLHLGSGYIRAAELITKAVVLFPPLKRMPDFSDDRVIDFLRHGAMEGTYEKARQFLTKLGRDPSRDLLNRDTAELLGLVEDIDREFEQ